MGSGRALTRTLAVLALLLVIAGIVNGVYPFMWVSLPMSGRVVDGTTGKPVTGAVVSATWLLTSFEGSSVRYLKVAEAVTDEHGRFRIGAWGPRFAFGLGRLKGSEPQIRVLSEGYLPVVGSRPTATDAPALLRYGYLDEPIRLNAVMSHAELEAALLRATIRLRPMFDGGCDWEGMPRTLIAVDRIRASLQGLGMGVDLPPLENLGDRACPDPMKLFREYRK